jgi:hypothetical protein
VAISWLRRPRAIRWRTSRSRVVSCGNGWPGDGMVYRGEWVTRSRSRCAVRGPKMASPRPDAADDSGDLVSVVVFEEVAAGTGSDGGEEKFILVEHAQHHDADARLVGRDLSGCFDAVEHGHAQVHDDDIGFQGESEVDSFVSVAGECDDVEPADNAEQSGKAFAEAGRQPKTLRQWSRYVGRIQHHRRRGSTAHLRDSLRPRRPPVRRPMAPSSRPLRRLVRRTAPGMPQAKPSATSPAVNQDLD